MARFALIGPSYSSQSPNADYQQSRNWYPEIIESGQGKSGIALYPTPGLSAPSWNLAPGPNVRGLYSVNGRLFAASGAFFYELHQDGSITSQAVVDDAKAVYFAAADINPTSGDPQLAFVSAGNLYVLHLLSGTFDTNPGTPYAGTPLKVSYADGFFVILNTNGIFQFSAPLDATSWPGINVATLSVFGDKTIAMRELHRELWFMTGTHGAVYYDSGNSPVPYDLVSGGDFEQGCVSADTLVPLDNTMFWLGANRDGAGIVWRASGYTPQRVSNHAVEFALRSYPSLLDAIAYGYQDQGHTFYVLYVPSASVTWVYDVSTNEWHERAFWDSVHGTWTAHRSRCHAYCFGNHYVGDWATGFVYRQDITIAQDFGNAIKRVRRSPHISNEDEWLFHDQLQIDMETGLGGFSNYLWLQASDGSIWQVSITDLGILQTQEVGGVPSQPVFNVHGSLTAFELGISPVGQLTTVAHSYQITNPETLYMESITGLTSWNVSISVIGVITVIQVININTGTLSGNPITHNPQLMLRWSDDGGHLWSNFYVIDCGAPGAYTTRAIIRRLGRSRDRIYELSTVDPIPWRLVDGFLKASPGYVPTERITDRIRKGA
jgi:hypothetical protein